MIMTEDIPYRLRHLTCGIQCSTCRRIHLNHEITDITFREHLQIDTHGTEGAIHTLRTNKLP